MRKNNDRCCLFNVGSKLLFGIKRTISIMKSNKILIQIFAKKKKKTLKTEPDVFEFKRNKYS